MSAPRRLRVLWICSWYPSEVDPFSGDFIQRHAEAVSSFVDVHVIHSVGDASRVKPALKKNIRIPHLTEWVYYFPRAAFFQRWLAPFRWMISMAAMFSDYRSHVGLPDLIHVQVPFKAGLLARYLSWRYGIKYVITEHWGIYNDTVADRFSQRSCLFRFLTRWAYKGASLSISVSRYLSNQMSQCLGDLPTAVVRNVVDIHLFRPSSISSAEFTFLHVSDWSTNKNPEGIIRAFREAHSLDPSLRLILVGGTGENYTRVKSFLTVGDANIKCLKEVSYADIAAFMKQSSCLVLFSWMENSPCVVGEALCAGLQVIATDVGGVIELADPASTHMIPAGDEYRLCRAMLEATRKQRVHDPQKTHERAAALFSYDIVGRQIMAGYRQVIG